LEEELHQGVSIPVGDGFPGRIVAENRPVILDEVDHDTVNPALLVKGLRSLLGVPLVASGRAIGVLHVGSLTARKFTSEDVEALQLTADRAAMAVQSLIILADRAAITVLQQSLMPSALPVIEGAEMAGRYVAGRGVVGGDWYDVFILPSGQLGVVIGDVSGSGLAAAVIMGRLRSALRAYALQTADPGEVLHRLDRKLGHFEPGALATVLYAVVDPGMDRAHISSAGHLPPVLAVPGQPAKLAHTAQDLMIGLDPDVPRQMATIEIPPGSVLCFYTDGLVERSDQPIDESLSRLCQTVTTEPADTVCSTVMQTLMGNEPAHDDIALLVFRRLPSDGSPQLT
jgi:serine phosphatase RsbU (regulator of sigma subunit)